MMGGQTLAQRRARHAWQAVEAACKKLKEAATKDYAREAKRFPVRIMTSGLGHALSFMHAKGGTARDRLTSDLATWLLKERGLSGRTGQYDEYDGRMLIDEIMKHDADFLRLVTEESLLYLQWLTRFAEAEIEPDEAARDAGQ